MISVVTILALCLAVNALPNNPRIGGRPQDRCELPGRFDEVRLALQWTPAICLDTSCSKSVNEFTIHGLWPSNNTGTDPEFCCSRPFSSQLIKHLEPKLTKYWMSIHGEDRAIGLWAHEWKKHGSCGSSSPLLQNQLSYFTTSVAAREKLPILEWLEDSNIFPRPMSQKALYSIKDVHKAIESRTGTQVNLDCKRLPNLAEPLLSGVYVCMDPNTLKPTNCGGRDRRCGFRNLIFMSN